MIRSRKALLAVLVLIIAGIAIYYFLESGSYEGQYAVERTSEPQDFILETSRSRGQVYAIELLFEGELSGEAVLTIGLPGNPSYTRKILKAGVIDTRYEGDWYYERCPIRYEPKGEEVKGRLLIKYRFVSTGQTERLE